MDLVAWKLMALSSSSLVCNTTALLMDRILNGRILLLYQRRYCVKSTRACNSCKNSCALSSCSVSSASCTIKRGLRRGGFESRLVTIVKVGSALIILCDTATVPPSSDGRRRPFRGMFNKHFGKQHVRLYRLIYLFFILYQYKTRYNHDHRGFPIDIIRWSQCPIQDYHPYGSHRNALQSFAVRCKEFQYRSVDGRVNKISRMVFFR
jgi:hypothetical protein